MHYRKWFCPLQASRTLPRLRLPASFAPGPELQFPAGPGGRCVITSRASRHVAPCRACRWCRPQRRVGAAAMLEEAGEVLESVLKASCLPLSFLLFVPAVLLLLGPPPAAEAAHEFTVYRMQQYELGGQPYGERRRRGSGGRRRGEIRPRGGARRGRGEHRAQWCREGSRGPPG